MNQNAPKIVIVVLVIVAVLFFVGVGVGAGGQNNGQGGLPGISVDSVVNSFSGLIPAPALSVNEIHSPSSGCITVDATSIVVVKGGNCHLEIKDSDANIRALKLTLANNQSIHIESTSDPVENKPMLTKVDLPSNGNTQITLNFFKTNSSVTFSECVPNSGDRCTLTVAH
jgi:hypothetical protein